MERTAVTPSSPDPFIPVYTESVDSPVSGVFIDHREALVLGSSRSSQLAFLDLESGKPSRLPVSSPVNLAALDQSQGFLYVTHAGISRKEATRVTRIALDSLEQSALTIPGEDAVTDLAVSPVGRQLYLAVPRSGSLLVLPTAEFVDGTERSYKARVLPLPTRSPAREIAILANGEQLLVVHEPVQSAFENHGGLFSGAEITLLSTDTGRVASWHRNQFGIGFVSAVAASSGEAEMVFALGSGAGSLVRYEFDRGATSLVNPKLLARPSVTSPRGGGAPWTITGSRFGEVLVVYQAGSQTARLYLLDQGAQTVTASQVISTRPHRISHVAISEDGRFVALLSEEQGKVSLFAKRVP